MPGAAEITSAGPLTAGAKFKAFTQDASNRFQFLLAGAAAGVGQAADLPSGYGQGAEGYGKRFGAAMAQQATGLFAGKFLLPALLHQDPRYFRRGQGSKSARVAYALTRSLVTRSDRGARQFNFSAAGGALAAGAGTNAYYPERDRGWGLTFSRAGLQFAAGAGFNLVKEFWPDLRRGRQRTPAATEPRANHAR